MSKNQTSFRCDFSREPLNEYKYQRILKHYFKRFVRFDKTCAIDIGTLNVYYQMHTYYLKLLGTYSYTVIILSLNISAYTIAHR